jgi:DNA-binding GntR family transcriptional regulator
VLTQAETLHRPAGEPVMVLEHQTMTADGHAIEFTPGVHTAGRSARSYSFPIPE